MLCVSAWACQERVRGAGECVGEGEREGQGRKRVRSAGGSKQPRNEYDKSFLVDDQVSFFSEASFKSHLPRSEPPRRP